MKSIEKIIEPLWDYVPDQLIGLIDDELEEREKEVIASALKEAGEQIDTEIEKLQTSKQEYGEIDDQYSWHIVDDEQSVWKKSKEIVRSLIPKDK